MMFDRFRWIPRMIFAGMLCVSPAAANKLANPGFELPDASGGDSSVITGWNKFGDPFTSFVTRQTPSHSGNQCLKMFGPWDQYGGTGMTQMFPASAGQAWVARAWSLNYSVDPMQNNNFCAMKIEFLDAAFGPAGGAWLTGVNVFEEILATAATPQDIWTLHGLGTAPAPAGTAYVNFVLVEVQMGNPISGGSVFLDDTFLNEACKVHEPVFDVDDDGKVEADDFDVFRSCVTGPAIPFAPEASQECRCMDVNADNSIDMQDFGAFQRCYTGASGALNLACAE